MPDRLGSCCCYFSHSLAYNLAWKDLSRAEHELLVPASGTGVDRNFPHNLNKFVLEENFLLLANLGWYRVPFSTPMHRSHSVARSVPVWYIEIFIFVTFVHINSGEFWGS